MNANFLTVAAVVLGLSAFGQTQQVGQENLAPTSASPQELSTVSQNSNRSILSNTPAQLSTTGANIPGAHSCAMHDLNQQHYASRGLLNEFNQSSLQGAQNASNLTFPETPNSNEISVIFHVVHNPNNPAENVSGAAILALFQELQEDYQLLNADVNMVRSGLGFAPADCDINFCLATQDENGVPLGEPGVVRVATTEDFYDFSNGEENEMKSSTTGGSDIWNRNNYLNIWICDITNGLNFGTAGYAYRPSPTLLPSPNIDGIVIDYNLGFGSNVLTHEVGHYLGLDHTWGGSGSCGTDDGFTDTPNTIGPADQQPGFNCGTASFQTCGATEVQYENYMDYATGCTYMFTQDQANYMVSILQGIRGSLLLSPGCDPTNTPPNSAFTSFPTGPSPVIIPQNASVNFYDASNNVPTGWAWTISGTQGVDWDWIGGSTAASQDPVAEFYSVGTYDVTLTASNGFGTDLTPVSELMYVQVAPSASGISCDTLRNWDPTAGISTVNWNLPTLGYVHGHTTFGGAGGENADQWAEIYSSPTTTDIRAIEFAPSIVSDGGGEVIWKIYADAAGQPGTVLGADTVDLIDITEAAWNQIDVNPPVTGIAGNFWVGYEITYTNPLDTFVLFTQLVSGLANTTSWEGATTGWQDIATTTGGGAGVNGLIDVLTSTGTAPVMDFSATGDSVCQGGNILVDGSLSTNNIDYRWYIDDSFPGLTNPVLDQSTSSSNTFNFPYAPGTYYMYLFGDGSCVTSGVFLPIEVLAPVTAIVSPTATTCGNNNGSITITGEAGGDGTYFYSLDGINFQSGNTFNNLAPGDYDVYVAADLDGCEAMYTVNVAASTPATATASASVGICPGDNATVTATGGGTYDWSDGFASIGTNPSEIVAPSITTQYSCLVTDALGCQTTVFATVTVNIPQQPTISASGATTICAGTTVDLTSSTPTGNVWNTTETSSTITVGLADSYTVTSNDLNGCSATSDPFVIAVNTAPAISSGAVNDPTSCGTSTGSIQVTGSSSGSISWTGTAAGNSGGSISLPFTIPNLVAGSYNITLVDGNGCTSNLLSQPLNDPTPPTTPVISNVGPITFCDGGSVMLNSSYTGIGNNWTTSETTDNITVTTSQTISVTFTDASGCSSTSNPIVITVNPLPTAPVITPNGPTTICDGETVTLSSSQGTGNVWSTSETSQDIDVTTSGVIDVIHTDANGCSATSLPITITVNPLPAVTLAPLSQVCDYTATFGLSGATPTGGTFSGTGVTSGDFDPATAGLGTHTITYEFIDANGCSNTATQDIVVDACLSIDEVIQAGLLIYPNPTDDVVFIELNGEFNYSVQDARGRLILDGNGNDKVSFSLDNVETGVYFINVTDKVNDTVSTARIVKQ